MSNQYLKLRRSGVPGKIPSTSSIDYGEIALNTYDGVAYMKRSGSNGEEVIQIGSPSGSFTGNFTGTFTGSLQGTASWALNAITASYYNETDPVFTAVSGTFTTTASFNAFTSSYNTGSFTGQFSGSFSGSGTNLFNIPASGIVGLNLSQISSGSYSASISETGLLVNNRVVAPSFTGSLFGTASWADDAISSSYALSASYALSSSHALTASHVNTLNQNVTVNGNQTISGSLTVRDNLVVLGSASITYISESTLNIGTNLITVNTFDASVRFGGLAVIDSGSSPLVSASFLYDSVQDEFIFVHKGDGTNLTSSHFILGPETYNNVGNEIYLTKDRLPKGTGIEHLNDSNITDTGTIVSINSNTQVTGSLVVSQGVTASLHGTASWANNLTSFPLNLTNPPSNGDLLIYDSNTAAWENSKTLTGSYEISGSLTTVGENIVCGSLIITNNSIISGSLVIGNNLTVFGDTTLLNLTSSQVDIGTSTLTLNVYSPAVRYGGLAIYDSGSSPTPGSSSLIYDTLSKKWIVADDFGSDITSSLVLLGPRTINDQGDEIPLTLNRLPKGTGTQHLNDSNISDNGSIVTISGSTQITGSLAVTAGISGSFSGSGANLSGIPASGIVGLNLSQISSGSVSASVSPTYGFAVNGLSAGTGSGDVIMYNTASGQFFFTGSSAIGGGNATNDNFQQIFLLMGG